MSPATLPLLFVLLVLTASLPPPWFIAPWLFSIYLVVVWGRDFLKRVNRRFP